MVREYTKDHCSGGFDPTTSIGEFGGESGKKQYLLGMPILGEVTRSPAPPTLPPAEY